MEHRLRHIHNVQKNSRGQAESAWNDATAGQHRQQGSNCIHGMLLFTFAQLNNPKFCLQTLVMWTAFWGWVVSEPANICMNGKMTEKENLVRTYSLRSSVYLMNAFSGNTWIALLLRDLWKNKKAEMKGNFFADIFFTGWKLMVFFSPSTNECVHKVGLCPEKWVLNTGAKRARASCTCLRWNNFLLYH